MQLDEGSPNARLCLKRHLNWIPSIRKYTCRVMHPMRNCYRKFQNKPSISTFPFFPPCTTQKRNSDIWDHLFMATVGEQVTETISDAQWSFPCICLQLTAVAWTLSHSGCRRGAGRWSVRVGRSGCITHRFPEEPQGINLMGSTMQKSKGRRDGIQGLWGVCKTRCTGDLGTSRDIYSFGEDQTFISIVDTFENVYFFNYLTVPGPSCSMWDL